MPAENELGDADAPLLKTMLTRMGALRELDLGGVSYLKLFPTDSVSIRKLLYCIGRRNHAVWARYT